MTGLKMIERLYRLVEEVKEPPSNTFTYAALAEMTRITNLSEIYAENRRDELPDSVLETWLYIAGEYYKLGHYLFSLEHYEKAAEAFSRCGDGIADNEELKSRLLSGFSNVTDILRKMGNKETEKEWMDFFKETIPSCLDEIQKPKLVSLEKDPVEYTERYIRILPELEAKIEAELSNEWQGEGYCFRYWHKKEEILKQDYGIKWDSPSVLNPNVRFD